MHRGQIYTELLWLGWRLGALTKSHRGSSRPLTLATEALCSLPPGVFHHYSAFSPLLCGILLYEGSGLVRNLQGPAQNETVGPSFNACLKLRNSDRRT